MEEIELIKAGDGLILKEVAECLKDLAEALISSSSSSSRSCWPQMAIHQLLLLQWRSKDVLSEFSDYSCLRLMLDQESPLAAYFIDLFYQLEWLLDTILHRRREAETSACSLPEELCQKAYTVLRAIKPVMNSCRYLFTIWCRDQRPSIEDQYVRLYPEKMKRRAAAYRDFSDDEFRWMTKMIAFGNLDDHPLNQVRLGEKVGGGSYADVYKGNFWTCNPETGEYLALKTGEPVAVKVFRYCDNGGALGESGGTSVGSQFLEQMGKIETQGQQTMPSGELWNLVSARHPNIVTARGYIGRRPEGESGIVMELMDSSLQDHLETVGRPLEEVEMIDLMLEIAKGLRFLHECNIVHKDLKPQNILLRSCKKLGSWETYPAMETKLADLGTARRFVLLQGDGDKPASAVETMRAGTYCYMAPELLQDVDDYKAEYQEKVDAFSYGTTCFNILTCEIPGALELTRAGSKSEADSKFYEHVRSNALISALLQEGGKPAYLVDLIAKCWHKDPSQRPTFATICSFLQRAMLYIISPPVINASVLLSYLHDKELREAMMTCIHTLASALIGGRYRGIPSLKNLNYGNAYAFGRLARPYWFEAALFLEVCTKRVDANTADMDVIDVEEVAGASDIEFGWKVRQLPRPAASSNNGTHVGSQTPS